MPNQKNKQTVTKLKKKIGDAKSVIIADYSSIDGNEMVNLRAAIKKAGGEMLIAKNTLFRIAADKDDIKDTLSGMNSFVFSYEDEVSTIKELFKFKEENEKLDIKLGFTEDRILSYEEIEKLSKLPSKDELIVTLMHRIKAPGNGLVNALNGNTVKLIRVLDAISKKE